MGLHRPCVPVEHVPTMNRAVNPLPMRALRLAVGDFSKDGHAV